MDNKISYNKIATQWACERDNSFVSKLVIEFADKINAQGHILDIGCGTGLPLAKYLGDRGFPVTGIDSSERMIEIAKSNDIPNAEFIVCDFFHFKPSTTFDGILAWDSLWHFPKKRQKEIYTRVGNMLNPGGLLLFTHGNVDDEHIDTMMGEPFYYSALAEPELLEHLDKNRLNVENVYHNFIENNSQRNFVALARKSLS